MNSSDISKLSIESSETSIKEEPQNQSGGGLMSLLFGNDKANYASELILDSFNSNMPLISCYLIRNALDKRHGIDFYKHDDNNKTVLHYMVLYSDIPLVKNLLYEVLFNPDLDLNINAQDKELNTVAHYALYREMEDLVKVLAERGADLSLKNNDGLSIVPKTPYDYEKSQPIIQVYNINKNNSSNIPKEMSDSEYEVENKLKGFLNNVVDSIVESTDTINFDRNNLSDVLTDMRNENTSEGTIHFRRNETTDVDSNTDTLLDELISDKIVGVNSNHVATASAHTIDTDTLLNELIRNNINNNVIPLPTNNAPNVNRNNTEVDTATLLNELVNNNVNNVNNTQQGGSRDKTYVGTRRLTTYSEMSFGNDSEMQSSEPNTSELENLHLMMRSINNEATKAHERAVNRIMELLGIEHDMAKAYKAFIYNKIKEERLELSNYDRAIELEKRASDKSYLDSLDKKEIKKLYELIKEKHASSPEPKEKKTSKKEKKKSKTSRQLSREQYDRKLNKKQSGGGFSETSTMSNYFYDD